MKRHGNSNENDSDHHLYEIYDVERQDVYKYKICGDPLLPDGTSPRANRQLRDYNRAFGWFRVLAKILLVGRVFGAGGKRDGSKGNISKPTG